MRRGRMMTTAGAALALATALAAWAAPALAAEETQAGRKAGEPPAKMATYYLGLIRKGPTWTPASTPEIQELQRAHLANMQRLHEMGKLVVAGPIGEGGDLRGIFVFKTASKQEAEELTRTDPMVKAGRLVVELHTWLVEDGVLP